MGPDAKAAAAACGTFARHFFASCDEAVQEYVCGSILSAAEEGDSLPELAHSLQDFLPPSASCQSLLEGLQQLQALLQQQPDDLEQRLQGLGWLQASAEQQPTGANAAATADVQSQTVDRCSAAPSLATEQQAQQTAANRTSNLSIAAVEFRPAAAAGAVNSAGAASKNLAASLGALQLTSGGMGSCCADAGDADDGWGAAGTGAAADVEEEHQGAGSWHHYETRCGSTEAADGGADHYGWQAGSRGSLAGGQQPWGEASVAHAEAAADAEAAAVQREFAAGGAATQAAFLAVLAEQFPLFSAAALQQLFEEQGGDLAATIQTLCSLENEIQGQQTATGWGTATDPAAGGRPQAGPSFTDDDFPTLGPSGGSGASTSAPRGSTPTDAGYAGRARAAAGLPDEPARRTSVRPPRRAAAGTPPAERSGAGSGAAPAAPAPIWQQAEGVQRYATGAVLAQEYEQLRAGARDHARLRNAFFQQATQAYLAGNRRLAKELGAKGRWHGEQMHMAHHAAAAQLFAQRNPGAAASMATGSSSGAGSRPGSSGSGGGVQTVDLHGLHVTEALDLLESLLLKLQARPGAGTRRLRVVVGVGQHAKVPARLPAAVRRYLEAQGIQYAEPYAGMLEIKL